MLYVTTREMRDAYTSHRAICEDIGPDGGRYVPFSLPQFTPEELSAFESKPFSQCVAEVLNLFFSSRLNSWDVDFSIGRNPMHLQQMSHRIAIAELWHNVEGKYDYLVNNLCKMIYPGQPAVCSDWMRIAVRIAILFGVYSELIRARAIAEDVPFDVSVLTGDFTSPMAVYYAKRMGLPIGCIICICTDNSSVWDFIHRGTFSPAGTDKGLRLGLERLILAVFGVEEVRRYIECCQKGVSYVLSVEQIPLMNAGFFLSVAGESRVVSTINSLYRTNSYIADPKTALCFGGLQDYRARTGESQLTLLLSDETPLRYSGEIAKIIGIEKVKLEQFVSS